LSSTLYFTLSLDELYPVIHKNFKALGYKVYDALFMAKKKKRDYLERGNEFYLLLQYGFATYFFEKIRINIGVMNSLLYKNY